MIDKMIVEGAVGIVGKIIDVFDRGDARAHEINKIETQGRVQEKLIKVKEHFALKKAEMEGNFGIEQKKLDNQRANENEEHVRKLQEMNNNFKLEEKKLINQGDLD